MAFKASTTLESSPPDTMLESGFKTSPTFGAIMKVALSIPVSLIPLLSQVRYGLIFSSIGALIGGID